jgi:uncharacterized protein (DUF2384 family)
MHLPAFLTGALTVALVAAHPGEDHHHEAVERRAFLENITRRDLSHCTAQLKARGYHDRSIQRRTELANRLSKRGDLRGTGTSSLILTLQSRGLMGF